MIKTRLPLLVLAAAAAVAIVTGCGGGGGSSSGDPATFAPASAPLYIEATLRPQGELKSNVEEVFEKATGIDTNLGEFIAEKLEESSAEEGEEVNFEKEVEPWLGEKAGLSFTEYDGDDFNDYAIAIQTTDADGAQEFIEKQVGESDKEPKEESYEGNDFYVEEDGTAVGLVGDYVVIAEGKQSFEEAVDASSGENLAGQDTFTSTFDKAADGSLADVFVDVGGLIEQAGGEVDPESMQIFESTGIKPEEATAVASLVPGSDQVEIDVSSDLGGQNAPSGDASKLLGSLPANSFAAVAIPGFGETLGQLIDGIDENGIPGQIPPHEFKSTLKQVGIDLDKITGAMGDAAVFAHGRNEQTLGGAAVIEMTTPNEANNLVSGLGLLLRANGTPGVTALSGKATGFSIRSSELGKKPIVVAAKDKRISIGYGVPDALAGLEETRPAPLSNTASFKQATSSLGGAPITAFADGQSTLKLIEANLEPEDKAEFEEAKPYLKKIGYLAVGSESSGDTAQAKMILGLSE